MMAVQIIIGDCLATLATVPAGTVQCCVTSPPYFGLRDYGMAGQIGLEDSPDAYVARLVEVFRAVRAALRDDGTLWLNLGDSYAGSFGAPSRGGPPSASSTLAGNGHVGGGPKLKALPSVQTQAASMRTEASVRRHIEGIKPKDLLMIPAMVALALRADGWFLRKDIIWHKPNPMPESVTDRPTSAHEHVFLLTKTARYFYDAAAIREAESVPGWDDGSRVFGGVNKHGANAAHGERTTGRIAGPRKRGVPPRHAGYASSDQSGLDECGRGYGRNARDVWTIATQPYSGAHFATMPPALAERCIKAGSRPGDMVLDPFGGAGTTGLVADRLGRSAILCEINQEYADLAHERIRGDAPLIASVTVA